MKEITFTNTSNDYVVIGDGKSLLFSGTKVQCEDYMRRNDLQSSGFSNRSILKPKETLRMFITSEDPD